MPNPSDPVILGLGEILWDRLPAGRQLGGAPANFAYHAQALGARGVVVSAVGDDALGREILQRLDALGLDRRSVAVDAVHPTGTVDVQLDERGSPRYVIHKNVAWDFIPFTDALKELGAQADAVCYGTLGQRSPVSRQTIRQFLASTRPGCLRVFDVNLRQHYYDADLLRETFAGAGVAKLNDEELSIVSELLGIASTATDDVRALLAAFPNLRMIALTRGPRGSVLVTPQRISRHAGYPAKVVDTVGAGDAFTAAIVVGLLAGDDLDRIHDRANRLASYVCTQPGATPPVPASIVSGSPAPGDMS